MIADTLVMSFSELRLLVWVYLPKHYYYFWILLIFLSPLTCGPKFYEFFEALSILSSSINFFELCMFIRVWVLLVFSNSTGSQYYWLFRVWFILAYCQLLFQSIINSHWDYSVFSSIINLFKHRWDFWVQKNYSWMYITPNVTTSDLFVTQTKEEKAILDEDLDSPKDYLPPTQQKTCISNALSWQGDFNSLYKAWKR